MNAVRVENLRSPEPVTFCEEPFSEGSFFI